MIGISGEVTEINLSNFNSLDREDSLFEISVPEGLTSLKAKHKDKPQISNQRTMGCRFIMYQQVQDRLFSWLRFPLMNLLKVAKC